MLLKRISYSEYKNDSKEWVLPNFTLGEINLIVGKNATGKTRTLNVIRGLADLFSEVDTLRWNEGEYDVEFDNKDELVSYTLEYHHGRVIRETIKIDDKEYMVRDRDSGSIFAHDLKKEIRFQTQANRVAAFAKRDEIQHPFLELFYSWGKGLRRYDFGSSLGKELLMLKVVDNTATELNLKEAQKVVEVFEKGREQFGKEYIDAVISDMAVIGYQLNDLGIDTPPEIKIVPQNIVSGQPLAIYAQETDRTTETFQVSMSQGMFRALSILIQINYSLQASEPSCLLIDDIGEGLDFERSTSLVKLLVEKVRRTSTQLIMATNDRFIMNSVPLEYWIILERKGGLIKNYNYRNSKEMFDRFELTGLNNFDLFSSDFYLKQE